ncbi:hypothetical protein AB1Y20_021442 [Prymnesium parvum]|uniref:D-xylose 1-dehydrogenase (NADP(+), D-xylono-1,5-lactone-forming) n=1 Tax=Prymnesium parvum TaxID=97485 RepID=A0AB34JIP9_PRYPA
MLLAALRLRGGGEPEPLPLDVQRGSDPSRVTHLRWGILGASAISSDWVKALRDVEGASVVAVAARSAERAEVWAREHAIAAGFGDYAELCASDAVDVVYVGTITKLHYEHAMLALAHGKHVVIEKPIGVSAEEARRLVEYARQRRLFLHEGMWTRFMPAVEKCRALIAEGRIGEPVAVHADFGFNAVKFEGLDSPMFDPNLAGSGMLPVGCYVVQTAPMVFGDGFPTKIAAAGTTANGVDTSAGITLQYGNDKLAVLTYNLMAETCEATEVIGTKGRIKLHPPAHCPERVSLIVALDRGLTETTDFTFPIPEPKGFPAPNWNYPNQHGFVYQARAIHRCIGEGWLECPQYPHAEVIQTMTIMDVAKRQIME